MGIGDRHSKRNAATKVPAPASTVQRPYVVDDRELDDAFSAWDEDDALARKPERRSEAPQLAHATSSALAPTRVERKPAAVGPAAVGPVSPAKVIDALVDPVAMRDIVISRARTLDDPLTTRVLAEIARSEALSDRPHRGRPQAEPDAARDPIVTARRRTTRRSVVLRDEPSRKK